MAIETNKVGSGFYMGSAEQQGAFSVKNVIEDFMKKDYEEGLRNEFNMMDALINHLAKDTITGRVKYKQFALGVADNVRAVGDTFDRYELGFDSFYNKGVETVQAQFDTTKLMAMFAITDEAILKGTGDGSLIDIMKDSLDRMEISLRHTVNRFTYGAPDGLIGEIKAKAPSGTEYNIETFDLGDQKSADARPTWAFGSEWNKFYEKRKDRNGKEITVGVPTVLKFTMTNSGSLLSGMGIMLEQRGSDTTPKARVVGRIWQKVNKNIYQDDILMFVETYIPYESDHWGTPTTKYTNLTFEADDTLKVYSRQLVDTNDVQREYCGLEAIVINEGGAYDTIFGLNRAVYASLNPTTFDLQGKNYISEELLRDMADHLALSSPDGTSINFCCAEHRIISAVEKSLYQFKDYTPQGANNGWQFGQVGAPEVRFDNFVLRKDKYARNQNVYMLDQNQIGELVRRDFQWITNGEVDSVLQRRPGTELYEGIMNKYADMYVNAFKCHGAIKNCKVPGVNEIVSYPYTRS